MRLLAALLIFISFSAHAQPGSLDPDQNPNAPFSQSSWHDQFHLLFGGGVNFGFFNSDSGQRSLGAGLDFRTDLGYYVGKKIALELSANVIFNSLENFVIWDTLFSAGMRFRLPFLNRSTVSIPYGRFFFGYGPSVAFPQGSRPLLYAGENASRFQLEGPVGGFGIGLFRMNERGRPWFIEIMASAHSLNDVQVIREENDVPIVIDRGELKDSSVLRSITVSAGMVAF